MKTFSLTITQLEDSYVITKTDPSNFINLNTLVAIRENLGEKYSYVSQTTTVLGVIRDFFETQAEVLEKAAEEAARKENLDDSDPDKDIPL